MHPERRVDTPNQASADLGDTILSRRLAVPLSCRVLVVDGDDLVRKDEITGTTTKLSDRPGDANEIN